jgi:adenylosuccinate lyase
VGKRATLWLQDLLFDYEQLSERANRLPFLGVKGTTGTQASFLELFNGDHNKVRELDRRVTEMMGFNKSLGVSGQTYTRKIDYQVHIAHAHALSVGGTTHKTDAPLLCRC